MVSLLKRKSASFDMSLLRSRGRGLEITTCIQIGIHTYIDDSYFYRLQCYLVQQLCQQGINHTGSRTRRITRCEANTDFIKAKK